MTMADRELDLMFTVRIRAYGDPDMVPMKTRRELVRRLNLNFSDVEVSQPIDRNTYRQNESVDTADYNRVV